MTIDLRKFTNAKCIPSKVKMKLYPDVLTEESVEVPIEAINMPEDKVMRTFPSKVKVRWCLPYAEYAEECGDKGITTRRLPHCR